jgi:hypothetical protein
VIPPKHKCRSIFGAVSLVAVAVVVVVLGVAGCGSGAKHGADAQARSSVTQNSSALAQSTGPAGGSGVAARIDGQVISVAMFDHRLKEELDSEAASERPAPPDFTACVTHREKAAVASGVSASRPSAAALKSECQKNYQALRQSALDHLISNVWVIGGARELGVAVSDREAKRQFKMKYVSTDALTNLDADAIRRAIKRSVGPMTATRVTRYYETHKRLYFVPQRRDLGIVRTSTDAAALAVKRELASGKSFASVVKRTPLMQPIDSKDGLVLELEPGFYHQRPLNQAIFAARPGVLSGPVKIALGYYVFEVKRIRPARQRPLAEVVTSIEKQLPEQLRQRALVAFIRRWRAKWTARTDCSPGYVVLKCRQFRASGAALPEDPNALD